MTTSNGPVAPGPGLRWTGDGALAPKPAAPRWGGDAPPVVEASAAPRQNPLVVASRHATIDGMVLAAMWRRLLAWGIDRSIKVIAFMIILGVSGTELTPSILQSPELIFALGLLSAGYEFVFGIRGVTPGGRVLRLRIARIDGTEPGVRRSLTRASAASLSEFFLFSGALLAFFDRRRQTVYDKLAGTIVVMTTPEPSPPAAP